MSFEFKVVESAIFLRNVMIADSINNTKCE
jgi:hypothetical protein